MNHRFEIIVSGAAELSCCCPEIKKISEQVGQEIAKQKCILVTGATTGVPYYAARGYKRAKGIFSLGFSPAVSEAAHLKTYKLPIDVFDTIVYTGADYVGRNILMTKSADGMITICGRMGTLHEFATAFEIQKPIAVLTGSGGMADKIKSIVTGSARRKKKIIYEKNPKRLVQKLIAVIEKEQKLNNLLLKVVK